MADNEITALNWSSGSLTKSTLGSSWTGLNNPAYDQTGAIGDGTIPAITLSASGDAYFKQSIPAITISASGDLDKVGRLDKSIPAIVIEATAAIAGYGSLDSSIPAITCAATGTLSPVASLERQIPAIQLTAAGIAGRVGSLEKSIGAITLAASAYHQVVGTLEKSIPAITLSAVGNSTIIALCLNTYNMALTKYTNFGFNSLCVFKGETLAAKAGGIYKLTGNTDDGEEIPWRLRVGAVDTINNRVTHVWLSGDISDDLTLTAETSDGSQYEYLVQSISEYNDETRVKVGKGLRSRYVTLELVPKTDAVLKLAKMNVFADALEKKR